MKNKSLESRLGDEIRGFIESRKSLQLSSLQLDGVPYASYAPFAVGDECLYVLLSEVGGHATNLQHNSKASILIIEDEDSCAELFARKRINYTIQAQLLGWETPDWKEGINALIERHGDMIESLSEYADFKLFRLKSQGGRYVKGFGRAYTISGHSLGGGSIDPMRDGHTRREVA